MNPGWRNSPDLLTAFNYDASMHQFSEIIGVTVSMMTTIRRIGFGRDMCANKEVSSWRNRRGKTLNTKYRFDFAARIPEVAGIRNAPVNMHGQEMQRRIYCRLW